MTIHLSDIIGYTATVMLQNAASPGTFANPVPIN